MTRDHYSDHTTQTDDVMMLFCISWTDNSRMFHFMNYYRSYFSVSPATLVKMDLEKCIRLNSTCYKEILNTRKERDGNWCIGVNAMQ